MLDPVQSCLISKLGFPYIEFNYHKKASVFNVIIYLFLLNLSALDYQSDYLIGKVVDENDKPLAYSHIGIENTRIGTISNVEGDFTLDISGISKKSILIVSSLGYKTLKIVIDSLSRKNAFKIILNKKIYSMKEISITHSETKEKVFGSDKFRGKTGWKFSGIATGNQIGSVFANSDSVLLSNLKFHVETKGYDSLLYRINIFKIDDRKLYPVHHQNIFKKSIEKTRIISLTLGEYNIQISQNFAVMIEILKGWEKTNFMDQKYILFKGRRAFKKQMLTKSHQFAPLEYDNIKLNMYISSILLE